MEDFPITAAAFKPNKHLFMNNLLMETAIQPNGYLTDNTVSETDTATKFVEVNNCLLLSKLVNLIIQIDKLNESLTLNDRIS